MIEKALLSKIVEVVKQACLRAGEVHVKYFQTKIELNLKGNDHKDVVTIADIESQKTIMDQIIKGLHELGAFENELGFIGEENLFQPSRLTFVIDPLDGTTNFAHGIDWFGCTVGVFFEGELVAGVVYLPILQELYWGGQGLGSWIETNEEISQLNLLATNINQSILACSYSKSILASKRDLQATIALMPVIRSIRTVGACVFEHALLLSGKTNIVVQSRTFIWDISGSQAIVEAAGGVVTDWQGNRLRLNLEQIEISKGFISGHPETVRETINYLRNIR